MRLIENGPDLPDELRRALDDERLVLFCGAGISMPERVGEPGLPTFGGLVSRVYELLPDTPMDDEQAAIAIPAYDRVLHLLERRVGRVVVRAKVLEILEAPGPSERHEAILGLSTLKAGGVRLVTTNFDRRFEEAATRMGIVHSSDVGPMLPVPKAHRWRSAVYLHGKISADAAPDDIAVNDLVYTSGDFGRAYLSERWASRFVTDLFATYKILFVGYSLEDPVMRYLVDAFASDRDNAGSSATGSSRAWAFAGTTSPADEPVQSALWRSKGVEPIPYRIVGDHDHGHLYRTLHVWAERKKFGLDARNRTIDEALVFTPATPFSGLIYETTRWAFEDVASIRRFCEAPIAPALEWLGPIEEWGLMSRGNVEGSRVDLRRCGPFDAATRLAPETFLFAKWASRHLDRLEFLEWVLEGGEPHPELQRLINVRLSMASSAGKTAPGPYERPILSPGLQQAWRLIGSPIIRPDGLSPSEVGGHVVGLDAARPDAATRMEILRLLTPIARLKSALDHIAIRTIVSGGIETGDYDFDDLIKVEVELIAGHQASVIRNALQRHPARDDLVAFMADDFSTLLQRCLTLFALGRADDINQETVYGRASIREHEQDRFRDGWTLLIDLARDGMAALRKTSPDRSNALLDRWRAFNHPLFQRLVMNEYIERL